MSLSAASRTYLETGWSFKKTEDSDDALKPVKKVPTVSHMDLLDNGLIPDPFINMNELAVEWVGETAWTYQTTFESPKFDNGSSVFLIFEGLDTFANVKLNGQVILESDNMFLSHRLNITDKLSKSGSNTLVIDFESALLKGRDLVKEHPDHKYVLFNGEAGRLTVRKAQYHWGWDWGPVLNTAGPWKPVYLEVSSAHIEHVRVNYDLAKDLKNVKGDIEVELEGDFDEARVSLSYNNDVVFSGKASKSLEGSAKIPFSIDNPHAWYPVGYGEPARYDVKVEIVKSNHVLDTWSKKTGFRRNELIQNEDSHGTSFYFRINNLDVFSGGSCWIPADNFLPRITPEKYRKWLELMAHGNQVMIRVWGGGTYEDDAFYDACDELGLLVWQDFMFGCGNYPVWPELTESIRKEAEQNVRRLLHHPSLIIYAGNNEDYQVQEQQNLEYNWEDKDHNSWLKSSFPARYYYEHLLPDVVSKQSQGIIYWPGSPFSNGKPTPDKTVGDMHQWNVWHGTQEKYQIFETLGGRFNSEFGMEAFPVLPTVEYYVTDDAERYPQSHTMDFHNKADGHERRIATYLVENFRPGSDLKSHIYLTQLCQSETMTFAYRGWKRQWGDDRRCGGILVWQLNDCWPGTSWSIVDYFLRRKPAFYTIARALKPLSAGAQRQHHDWSVVHARPAKTSAFDVWATSIDSKEVKVDVEVRFISIKTGADVKEKVVKNSQTLTPNGTTEILSGVIDNTKEEPHVIAIRILKDGVCVARDIDWPQPLKYLNFSDRQLKIEASGDGFVITAQKPTKGLVLDEVDGNAWSDNCIDIIPGEEVFVKSIGENTLSRVPGYQYLGMQYDY